VAVNLDRFLTRITGAAVEPDGQHLVDHFPAAFYVAERHMPGRFVRQRMGAAEKFIGDGYRTFSRQPDDGDGRLAPCR